MRTINEFKNSLKYKKNLFTSVEVRADVRTLRAIWTPSLAEDLRHYHNMDAEELLTQMLNQMISPNPIQQIKYYDEYYL